MLFLLPLRCISLFLFRNWSSKRPKNLLKRIKHIHIMQMNGASVARSMYRTRATSSCISNAESWGKYSCWRKLSFWTSLLKWISHYYLSTKVSCCRMKERNSKHIHHINLSYQRQIFLPWIYELHILLKTPLTGQENFVFSAGT